VLVNHKTKGQMQIKVQILSQSAQIRNGVEYVTVTGMEIGEQPLLQMVDYTLRPEESNHKGALLGKSVKLQVECVRALFAGRPQLSGRILEVSK